jgi:hypothetical protein
MSETISLPPTTLKDAFIYAPMEGKYIDPIKLLQYLEGYAIILSEQTAKPGLDAVKTELARGQRLTCLALRKQIEEELNNAPD